MKTTFVREETKPALPPITGVILEMSVEEARALKYALDTCHVEIKGLGSLAGHRVENALYSMKRALEQLEAW